MVRVKPKYLTFTSGESMPLLLHECHEVPRDVGVTLALEFFLPVAVARGAPKALFVEILEGLLLEFDVVPFHELHGLFCFSQHFILHVQTFDEEPIVDDGSRRVLVLVEGLDGDSDDLAFDVLRKKRHSRPERVAVVLQVRLELVQRQKGRGVLLKLLVKQSKKLGRRPVDEQILLIAGLDTERVRSAPVHHSKKLCLRFISAEARRFTGVLAFYHLPVFGVSSNRAVMVSSMMPMTFSRCSSRFAMYSSRRGHSILCFLKS